MLPLNILTDSTAQFPVTNYEGHELVSTISLHIRAGKERLRDTRDPRIISRLADITEQGAYNSNRPGLVAEPPGVDEFIQTFLEMSARSSAVVAILCSENLCDVLTSARQAAEAVKGTIPVNIIDSQTIGPGLGWLVMAGARLALRSRANGHAAAQAINLCRQLRGMLPHVYTCLCLQDLEALAYSGHLDPAQAIVANMLGMQPFYVIESGHLTPVQKVRNTRQMIDLLHEFACEFDELRHIAILQGMPPYEQEIRSLRDRLESNFPQTPFSEHLCSASLLAIFGARSLGLVAVEASEYD